MVVTRGMIALRIDSDRDYQKGKLCLVLSSPA